MILVWFRRDLRTVDHTALSAALSSGEPVVACFVATPDQWHQHHMSPMQADMIARRLHCLNEELTELNIPFLYQEVSSFCDVTETIVGWGTSLGVSKVMVNIHYEVNEQSLDREVSSSLNEQGVVFEAFHDKCVHAPTTVLNKQGNTLKYLRRSNELGCRSLKCRLCRSRNLKRHSKNVYLVRSLQIVIMTMFHSVIRANQVNNGMYQPARFFTSCERLCEKEVMRIERSGTSQR